MTKQEAPEVEPVKKPVQSRGHFIDFAPKRARRATPVPASIPDPVEEPISEPDSLILDDFVDPGFSEEPNSINEFPDEITPEIPEETSEVPEKASKGEASKTSEETPKTPEKPARRARKPLINTSGIFDFIRPKTAKKAPEAVVEQISVASVSASTPRSSLRQLTVADVIRPKRAKRPQITPEEVAGFTDDIEIPATTPEEIADFSALEEDDNLPPVNEDDLAIALAGFADEPDSPGLSAPVPTDDLSREAADFAEEIDALDELATGDGNKIDDELAEALDLETKEFVAEPKPLFNRPKPPVKPVATVTTVAAVTSVEPEIIENERVSDQDFASGGRGINYDPLVKDAERAEEEARKRAEEKEKARIAKAKAEAPDGNMYTLGGRSPFLTSVHVEKRPLSQYVPSNMTSLETMAETPVKNVYRAKLKKTLEDDAKEIHRQTLIVSPPMDSKTRSTALVFAILLTVLLGAGVGALVYLVFFQ